MKTRSPTARRGILAGGNWIVEQTKVIDAFPQAGHLANVLSQSSAGAGAAHNVLVDLAQSGAPFPLFAAGLVGKDAPGDELLVRCHQLKVDMRGLGTTEKAPTSSTDVMADKATGQRTFFHARGANALWAGVDLDFNKVKARIFHLGYLLLLDALDAPDGKFGTKGARLLAAAQAAGLKTSIDVFGTGRARFAETVTPALQFVDYCILDEVEAGKAAGFQIRQADGQLDTVALRHAAGALLQRGVREYVVIHFPEGAFARTRKGEDIWQPALKLPAKAIASAAGAGDAFCAGALLGLHEGWELPRCLLTGVCVAAAALTDATATGGVKSLGSSLALAKKFGFRPALEKGD